MQRIDKARVYLTQKGIDWQGTEKFYLSLTYERLKEVFRQQFEGEKVPRTKSAIVERLVIHTHRASFSSRQLKRIEACAA